jgi:class 3 adenylate cyclase
MRGFWWLAQVISLGAHEVLGLSNVRPQTLTELSASSVSQRSFPPVPSHKCLVPGFLQAPEAHKDLTIMFCNVISCPAGPEGCDAEEFTQAYDLSVKLYAELARRLLTQFNGYECKEPEKGKFIFAFKSFKNAVGFAVTIQSDLMDLEYPAVLLEAVEFAEERVESDDALLYRGLRVKIGMAHGRASMKKPIRSTGRADYFGILPNTAARLMSEAAPGQVLTDGTLLHDNLDPKVPYLATFLLPSMKRHSLMSLSGPSMKSSMLRSPSASRASISSNLSGHSEFGGVGGAVCGGSYVDLNTDAGVVGHESNTSVPAYSLIQDDHTTRRSGSGSGRHYEVALSPIPTESGPVFPVIARFYGMYMLKGVPEATPLVQLTLKSLELRNQEPSAQKA